MAKSLWLLTAVFFLSQVLLLYWIFNIEHDNGIREQTQVLKWFLEKAQQRKAYMILIDIKFLTAISKHNVFNEDEETGEAWISLLQVCHLRSPAGIIGIPCNASAFIDSMENSHFIPCNTTRAASFFKHHPLHTPDLQFNAKVWQILLMVTTFLGQLNVPFWLSSGTCLGYFRQCGVIPYSKDVDIGVWAKDYDPRIVPTFSSHGLPLKHWFGMVNDSLELSFKLGEIKLDIFFFYEDADYVWNGGTQARTGNKYIYTFPKFNLCWTEFLDLLVRIPCQTEAYIEANYGKNWLEPQQVWDWKTSPSNVQPNGQWDEKFWPEVIQVYDV